MEGMLGYDDKKTNFLAGEIVVVLYWRWTLAPMPYSIMQNNTLLWKSQ
jgi:hypothetical protein